MANTPGSTMTIREAIANVNRQIRNILPNKDADTVRIMEHVTEMNETGVLQSLDKPLTQKQEGRLRMVISRLNDDEPLEYITGIADFQGRKFYVSKHTLIPRPETEMLVNLAVGHIMDRVFESNGQGKGAGLTIADVGTGSGCIIISMALMIRENMDYYASDISDRALSVAQKNIEEYSLDEKITTLKGNLLEPFEEDLLFDVIVANLPYLKDEDFNDLDASVKEFEPRRALAGGDDGIEIIGGLLTQASGRMNNRGVILLEVQPEIAGEVVSEVKRFFPAAKTAIHNDLAGKRRFVQIDNAN